MFLDNALVIGEIDFLNNSLHSTTSIKQLVHEASLIVSVGKCAYDARLLSMKNTVFPLFELPTTPIIDNTRTIMLVALFNQSFVTSGDTYDKRREIFMRHTE